MTSLRLQNMFIPDCEDLVERGFYDWCKKWSKDSPPPDWQHAPLQVKRDVALIGYKIYEGIPQQHGNELGAAEVFCSLGINSRMEPRYDVVRFLQRSDEARAFLGRIPDGTVLENGTEDQISAAAGLIDLLSTDHQIKLGKATKVLYKKRPGFIPVIDSVVSSFLNQNFPHCKRSSNRDVLILFRHILLVCEQPLR